MAGRNDTPGRGGQTRRDGPTTHYNRDMGVRALSHPLAQQTLAVLRDKDTPPDVFRRHADILSSILILEATSKMSLEDVEIETPLEAMTAKKLAHGLAVVPILRAGLAMLQPALELFPEVAVGYIGLERSHDTAVANSYYCKLPPLEDKYVLCVDPMLATGGSAAQALSLIKAQKPAVVKLVVMVAAPEGIIRVSEEHPDVTIITGAIDRELNEMKYILPGLGDAGDRLFGT